MTRPFLPSYPGYGYQEQQYGGSQMQSSSPMQGVEMQYPPTYMSDAARQQQVQASPSQQHQQYAQYGPGSMLPPVGASSLYENIPFQQRQTAIEVMASQFAVPQYMQQGEHTGVGVGSGSTQYMTSQAEQGGYGHVSATRPSMPQPYGAVPGDFPVIEQQEAEEPAGQSGTQEALDEGLREYSQQLRSAFDAIVAGRVTVASEKVMALSRWLVSSVTALGKLRLYFPANEVVVLTCLQDCTMMTKQDMQSALNFGENSICAGRPSDKSRKISRKKP